MEPFLYNRQPLSLSTSIAEFIQMIEQYSAKMNASWCKNSKDVEFPAVNSEFHSSFLNEPVKHLDYLPYFSSDFRDTSKSCSRY